jgi:DNA-binding NtrC family response regulator
MNHVSTFTPQSTAAGLTEPMPAPQSPSLASRGFGCVYLTSSTRSAEQASVLLEIARIRIYRAASLKAAEELLRLTRSRVLMADTTFEKGAWQDALYLTSYLRPLTVLVVAARSANERLWIEVLERGAYDLVARPFHADELRRVLENARSHAMTAAPLRMTA